MESLNQARAHHAMVAYDGKLYVCGGLFNDSSGILHDLSSVEIYDSSNGWITQDLSGTMNDSRSDFVLVTVHGLLWAIGGYDPTEAKYYLSPDVYDPICKTWTKLDNDTMTYPRSGLGGGVLNDNIYVTGGIAIEDEITLNVKST